MIRLHRLHGFAGGLVYGAWAVLYDLVSFAMIAFAVTGVYLWYRRTKDRRLGWALLSVSWILFVVVTLSLRFTP